MDIKSVLKLLCSASESFQMDKDIAFLMNQEATTVNIQELVNLIKQKEAEFEKERNR